MSDLTPEQQQLVDLTLEMFGVLDIILGDFPEGIQDYHHVAAAKMGGELSDDGIGKLRLLSRLQTLDKAR